MKKYVDVDGKEYVWDRVSGDYVGDDGKCYTLSTSENGASLKATKRVIKPDEAVASEGKGVTDEPSQTSE